MNQPNLKLSRRDAVRLGAGAVVGVVVACGVCTRASAAQAKLTKAAVQYTDVSTDEGKDCDDCTQYIAPRVRKGPATCKIVEGTISPHGHCIAFSPKAKS